MTMKIPTPGKDGLWIALCRHCDDMELFVTRGGFRNGGIEHCYRCGNERTTTGMNEEDIKRNIISSWCHWQKWKPIPYNWHTLDEDQKLKLLYQRAYLS